MSNCSSSTSVPVSSTPGTFKYTRRYHPKCDLAELIVATMNEQHLGASKLTKAMGYPAKHSIAAIDRLRHVLCSANLGLDGSYIDAYYDSEDFVINLCELLAVDQIYYQQQIDQIMSSLQ